MFVDIWSHRWGKTLQAPTRMSGFLFLLSLLCGPECRCRLFCKYQCSVDIVGPPASFPKTIWSWCFDIPGTFHLRIGFWLVKEEEHSEFDKDNLLSQIPFLGCIRLSKWMIPQFYKWVLQPQLFKCGISHLTYRTIGATDYIPRIPDAQSAFFRPGSPAWHLH